MVFTGQVGAIQLGVSRALQNWEPDLRPALKDCNIFLLPFVRLSFLIDREKQMLTL